MTTEPDSKSILRNEWRDLIAMMFLAIVLLWGQIQNDVLRSVDGIVYALVGKELVARPLHEWAVLTWNHLPYFENPHLTPWLIAGWMKLFGVSTLSAILPITILSTFTVWVTYLLGRELIGHRFGILAGMVLIFTPSFIKDGRNPMLEPAMMFFIMLSLYFYLRALRRVGGVRDALFAGLSLGGAFLSKGPPSLLAPATMLGFELAGMIFPDAFAKYRVDSKRIFKWLIMGASAVILLGAIDLWHYLLSGVSFFAYYFAHQLQFTVLEARGAVKNDWNFYIHIFFHYWPWLPILWVSVPWIFWKKEKSSYPALVLGACVTVGTFLGFTLMKHKAPWYVTIHYVSSSLLIALVLKDWISENLFCRHFVSFCAVVALPILLLSASFPSIFILERPYELFLIRAEKQLKTSLEGQTLADCASPPAWQTPFMLQFYLGMTQKPCGDASSSYHLVNLKNYSFKGGEHVLFSEYSFALIKP